MSSDMPVKKLFVYGDALSRRDSRAVCIEALYFGCVVHCLLLFIMCSVILVSVHCSTNTLLWSVRTRHFTLVIKSIKSKPDFCKFWTVYFPERYSLNICGKIFFCHLNVNTHFLGKRSGIKEQAGKHKHCMNAAFLFQTRTSRHYLLSPGVLCRPLLDYRFTMMNLKWLLSVCMCCCWTDLCVNCSAVNLGLSIPWRWLAVTAVFWQILGEL